MKKILSAILVFAGLSTISLSQDLNRIKEPGMLRELHHINAFEYFAGVPATVKIDNLAAIRMV